MANINRPRAYNVGIALHIADGYMKTAHNTKKELESLDESDSTQHNKKFGVICLAISSFAFSLELYFKCIINCVKGETATGHELDDLWNKISESIQNWLDINLQNNYKPKDNTWSVLLYPSFNPKRETDPEVIEAIREKFKASGISVKEVFKSEIEKFETYGPSAEEILRGHNNVFHKGRYGFELPDFPEMKSITYDLTGLQVLSWLTRQLAHHYYKELQQILKVSKGKSNSQKVSIKFPTGSIEIFPKDK